MSTEIDSGCFIYQRGKTWWISFTDKGQEPYQKRFSLKTKDKKAAVRMAHEKCADWKRSIYNPWKALPLHVTVDEAIEHFKRERSSEVPTWKGNVWILRQVCQACGLKYIRGLNADCIRRVIWQRPGLTDATRRSYFNNLNPILNWLTEKGYFEVNPNDDVLKPPKEDRLPKYYSGNDIERLLHACSVYLDENEKYTFRKSDNPLWFRDAFELVAWTGLRKSETAILSWGDIVFPDSSRKYGRIVIRATKKKKTRVVTMLPVSERILRRLEMDTRQTGDPAEIVLKNHTGKDPIAPNFLSRKFTSVQKFAGLEAIGLHGLRHSFAIKLLFQGVGIREIQEQMGHADVATTERYTQLRTDDVLRLTYERFV